MTLPLRLDDPAALPGPIREQLAAHRAVFENNDYLDSFVRQQPIASIAEELNRWLRGNRILGFHCTREPETGYFEHNGLRLTDVQQHQADFLQRFGDRFTEDELRSMLEQWTTYFDHAQLHGRNGRIWACLSRSQVRSAGASKFFRYFGGEAIYFGLDQQSPSLRKLEQIGRPVVVEVSLPRHTLRMV